MGSLNTRFKRPPRALVIAGVLAVLCGLYWFKSRTGPGAAAASDAVPTTDSADPKAPKGPAEITVSVSPKLRRDPFSSPLVFPPKVEVPVEKPRPVVDAGPDPQQVALEVARRDVHLSAIFMSQNPEARAVAIVNGVAYRAGDNVLGFEIKRIEPRAILLERDGAKVLVSVK